MQQLPVDVVKHIANYLDLRDAKNLSYINRYFFKALNGLYFEKRLGAFDYENRVINATIKGIQIYLKNDKKHPGYKGFHWTEPQYNLKYDKGFHRAYCFLDVLKKNTLHVEFKLLAIFFLLNEKNGAFLKKRVVTELQSTVGFNVIKQYLQKKYSVELKKLSSLKKTFLNRIHDSDNYHSGKENAGEYDTPFYGWLESLYNEINKQINSARKLRGITNFR